MQLSRRVGRLEDQFLPPPPVQRPLPPEMRKRMDELIERMKADPDGYQLDAEIRRKLGLPEKTPAKARVKKVKG